MSHSEAFPTTEFILCRS